MDLTHCAACRRRQPRARREHWSPMCPAARRLDRGDPRSSGKDFNPSRMPPPLAPLPRPARVVTRPGAPGRRSSPGRRRPRGSPLADRFERRESRPGRPARADEAHLAQTPSLWEDRYVVFDARRGDERLGQAVVVEEIGKHRPITFVVGVRPGGAIADVAVMAYREAYGGDVRRTRFLSQYRGKRPTDPLRTPQTSEHRRRDPSVEAATGRLRKAQHGRRAGGALVMGRSRDLAGSRPPPPPRRGRRCTTSGHTPVSAEGRHPRAAMRALRRGRGSSTSSRAFTRTASCRA